VYLGNEKKPKRKSAQNGMRLWDPPALKNRAFGWRSAATGCGETAILGGAALQRCDKPAFE
jgi:hypothetical protein